ncbi:hypothetical protein [Corynebacterium sp.]|uniref:hypothetical protein n=1 Tax=Corynebacterium sp. TaxID=1720 RepID=UPI0026DAB617|nr:hypothetical protein [Corynebacterium sp.]MDO5031227.1 hypothetical protein [Corynebacterium sp.]
MRACLVLAAILSGAIAWIYPTKYVQGWCVFGLFPLGAGLLAVLVWPVLKPAWGLLRTEYPHITQSVLILCALIVAAVVCMGWLLGLSSPGAVMALATTLCFFLAAVLCMVKWGAAVTLALSIILTIFSATIGGDVLADSALWILAMPAWPEIATSAARFPIALVLSIAMSAAAWIGASTLLPKLLTR